MRLSCGAESVTGKLDVFKVNLVFPCMLISLGTKDILIFHQDVQRDLQMSAKMNYNPFFPCMLIKGTGVLLENQFVL